MAIVGIDLDEVFEYVSPNDKGEIKTVFLIKPLTVKERVKLMRMIGTGEDVDVNKVAECSAEIVEMGLKGVKNLQVKGELKDFFGEDVRSAIDMLPLGVLVEVAGKVIECNFLSESEEKN